MTEDLHGQHRGEDHQRPDGQVDAGSDQYVGLARGQQHNLAGIDEEALKVGAGHKRARRADDPEEDDQPDQDSDDPYVAEPLANSLCDSNLRFGSAKIGVI